MIDLHYWPTPNGKKVTILLEECGLPYKIVPVNIGRGDQFKDAFLEMNLSEFHSGYRVYSVEALKRIPWQIVMCALTFIAIALLRLPQCPNSAATP